MARAPHRSLVLSAFLSTRGREERAALTGFVPPRGSFLLTVERPAAAAKAISEEAAPDAILVLDAWRSGKLDYDPGPWREEFPEVEVLTVDPDELLRFLWHYRDRHDPLALGHSRERALFPEGVLEQASPAPRTRKKRETRRRAVDQLRDMLFILGASLGVRPPLPPMSPLPSGWSPTRVIGVLEACAGLYAGLLYRWGAPIAVRDLTSDGPDLRLADKVHTTC